MTLEEQLKTAILARYKSVRAFTLSNGIPYSTMDSIMKRGIMNAGVGTMLKIFDALDLDIESIADGEIKSKENLLVVTQCSVEAARMAAAYDRADEKSRSIVRLTLADFLTDAEPSPEAHNVHDWTDAEMHAELQRQLDAEKRETGEPSTSFSGSSGAATA